MEEHSDRWAVEVPRHVANTSVHPDYVFDAEAEFGRKAPLIVEIGSGLGDAVCHAAEQNPDTDFLAVEVYTPGLANTLIKINSRGLTNVRVVEANAPEVLASMLPEGSVTELWVFFPDPWHKSRHHKRRLIQPAFAELAAERSNPAASGGSRPTGPTTPCMSVRSWRARPTSRTCTTASAAATTARSRRSGSPASSQSWEAPRSRKAAPRSAPSTPAPTRGVDDVGGWAPRFEGRILTSFENKAHEAGRLIFDLCYRRADAAGRRDGGPGRHWCRVAAVARPIPVARLRDIHGWRRQHPQRKSSRTQGTDH